MQTSIQVRRENHQHAYTYTYFRSYPISHSLADVSIDIYLFTRPYTGALAKKTQPGLPRCSKEGANFRGDGLCGQKALQRPFAMKYTHVPGVPAGQSPTGVWGSLMLSTSANLPSDEIASAFHWRGFVPVSTLSRIRAESAGGGLLLATDCPIPASTTVVLAGIRTGSSRVRANPPRHAGSRTYTAPPPRESCWKMTPG